MIEAVLPSLIQRSLHLGGEDSAMLNIGTMLNHLLQRTASPAAERRRYGD
ncbi:hypothetical protein [Roseateles sp. BYS96W]|uniref:Uncharacterized protein n=1 Tax=Pelomonas nitida TaxID=3299027 RepID=A0ABW7G9W2_9BURK